MDSNAAFKAVLIRPKADFGTIEQLHSLAGIPSGDPVTPRLFDLPLVAIVTDAEGMPIWEPTHFLADTALRSRSLLGDTVRTYSEALLPWLSYLKKRSIALSNVTEETLGEYRARIAHMSRSDTKEKYSSATVNQRIIVPACFHAWGQRRNSMPSPLGAYLESLASIDARLSSRRGGPARRLGPSRVTTPRVIRRLPTALSVEQIRRLFWVTPMPYRLMLRWAVATGMRRSEIVNLRITDLPTPEQIAQTSDDLIRIQIMRKGSRDLTVHVPSSLVEETNWFVLLERSKAKPTSEQHVFLSERGFRISRQALTRIFRRSADAIGTNATLHHLRHTFAVHVLGILERRHEAGDALNSLKTLQVMLGHASLESTEIYLEAMQTSSDAVMEALNYLYGATL